MKHFLDSLGLTGGYVVSDETRRRIAESREHEDAPAHDWNITYDTENGSAEAVLNIDAMLRKMAALEDAALRELVIRELRRQGYVVIPPDEDLRTQ